MIYNRLTKVLVLLFLTSSLFSATRAIVPRADNEGLLGTEAKTWGEGNFVGVQTSTLSTSAIYWADGTVQVSSPTGGSGGASDFSSLTSTSTLYIDYGVNASTGVFTNLTTDDLSATYGVAASTGVFTSTVTALSFSGDGSNLTGISSSDIYWNHQATTNITMNGYDVNGAGNLNATYGVNSATSVTSGGSVVGGTFRVGAENGAGMRFYMDGGTSWWESYNNDTATWGATHIKGTSFQFLPNAAGVGSDFRVSVYGDVGISSSVVAGNIFVVGEGDSGLTIQRTGWNQVTNTGIGTGSPAEKLEVNGNIKPNAIRWTLDAFTVGVDTPTALGIEFMTSTYVKYVSTGTANAGDWLQIYP